MKKILLVAITTAITLNCTCNQIERTSDDNKIPAVNFNNLISGGAPPVPHLEDIERQCNGKQDQALWDCVDHVLREYGLIK